jgi:hypothetical protein
LKSFDERYQLRTHMRRKGHTIDGPKALAAKSDEARMAEYHRERTGERVSSLRYGK